MDEEDEDREEKESRPEREAVIRGRSSFEYIGGWYSGDMPPAESASRRGKPSNSEGIGRFSTQIFLATIADCSMAS